MIYGIGTDIIETERLKQKFEKGSGFRDLVFSHREIEYCETLSKNKFQHYAGKFAAKEAFIKAMGIGLNESFILSDIEVLNEESGKPFLNLKARFAELIENLSIKNIHLSVSHIQEYGCAMVVLEK